MGKKPRIYQYEPFQLNAGPDAYGNDWYVGVSHQRFSTWLYPTEAKRLGKLLLKLAQKPKKARKRGKKR